VTAQPAPAYWGQAKRAIARADPVMGEIMKRYPRDYMTSRGDPFVTLARSIVGQQISVKAAQSVWQRTLDLVGEVTPANARNAGPKQLRGCGLSERKVEYVLDLALHFDSGRLQPARWAQMDDEAVIEDLTAVRGIGRWTAEMFLMFNLLRPDVFPIDDIGVQRGIQVAYYKGRKVAFSTMRRVAEKWRPYRSVATWYLWRSLDPVPVEY
jgi:DNA-3-methyladenine glycosylase II